MALKTDYPTSSPWPPQDLANDLNENFAKLAEVSLSTSPTDGSLLVYNASAELFEDQVVTYTLGELTTVSLSTTPNDGDVLTYDASSDTWVDAPIATTLEGLTDVVLSTTPNDGSALVYDASSDTWVDGEAAGGDPTINSQTGTSYTLVIGDAYNTVSMDNASSNTLTIPTNASVAFDTGTVIAVLQEGAGTTTISGDTGVTVNGTSGGSEDIGTQYASAALVKVGTDEWVVAVGSGSGGGGGSSTLDGLSDTALSTTPNDGDVLTYDASSDTWVDAAPNAGGSITTENYTQADLDTNGELFVDVSDCEQFTVIIKDMILNTNNTTVFNLSSDGSTKDTGTVYYQNYYNNSGVQVLTDNKISLYGAFTTNTCKGSFTVKNHGASQYTLVWYNTGVETDTIKLGDCIVETTSSYTHFVISPNSGSITTLDIDVLKGS